MIEGIFHSESMTSAYKKPFECDDKKCSCIIKKGQSYVFFCGVWPEQPFFTKRLCDDCAQLYRFSKEKARENDEDMPSINDFKPWLKERGLLS